MLYRFKYIFICIYWIYIYFRHCLRHPKIVKLLGGRPYFPLSPSLPNLLPVHQIKIICTLIPLYWKPKQRMILICATACIWIKAHMFDLTGKIVQNEKMPIHQYIFRPGMFILAKKRELCPSSVIRYWTKGVSALDIPRIFTITESAHRIHNPFTSEKLATLGAVLRLEAGIRILDLGSGSGEMLCTWARD